MNGIQNLKIDVHNKLISLTVSTKTQLSKDSIVLCVDECWNSDNIFLDNIGVHNYIFCSDNSEILIEQSDDTYDLTFINDDIYMFDLHMKYIKLINTEYDPLTDKDIINVIGDKLFYLPDTIYQAEITTIYKCCQNCLDDKHMQLLVYVTFKRQLLENAIELNESKMALNLYKELCRILGVTLDQSKGKHLTVSENCLTCVNGVCNINNK